MKKLLCIMMCVGMSLSMLTGCNSGTKTPADSADKSSTDSSAKKGITTKEDLKGASIGVQLGTTGDLLASDLEADGSKIERFSKGTDAVIALNSGKIDCVVIDSEPAKAFVAKNKDLKVLDEPFELEEYAICVSKDKPELTASINKALAELKSEGTLDKIMSNYIGDDTKGKTPYTSPENVDRSKGKLIMATNAAFEPYEFLENEKIVGIDADMAQAVCDKLGMELEIQDMEFDSIITSVQSGKADIGVAGMSITEERKQNIDFTDPYVSTTQVIIVKDNK